MSDKHQAKQNEGPVWGRRLATEAGRANVEYCAGWDVRGRPAADLQLLPYDLWTNRAHCTMLAKIGLVPGEKLKMILTALDKMEEQFEAGAIELDPQLEDVHLNVERYVGKEAGDDVSGMMHTARSRNDQVATDMRLYLRDQLLAFAEANLGLVRILQKLAEDHAGTLIPGITHQQPASWTTFGHWMAAHACAFLRDTQSLLDLFPLINQCPLGAAASYGTSWPIDREFSARLLGFDSVQTNTLDCVTNRSEFESRVASVMAMWAKHAATLSQDLIMMSSPPWSLIRLSDSFVTGSSIMPQKRNPDFAEVTKAKATLAGSIQAALLGLTLGDPSGYNREQQWSKYLIMQLFDELGKAPVILSGALDSIQLDEERMRTLMAHDYLEAADVADFLAQRNDVPFRKAYQWLGEAVRLSEERKISLGRAVNQVLDAEADVPSLSDEELENLHSPEYLVQRRKSQGGPSAESLRLQVLEITDKSQELRKRAEAGRKQIQNGREALAEAMRKHSA
ncbi:MAG: argininosuccinate lyase [Candidatus Sumerlaeia bacterium]